MAIVWGRGVREEIGHGALGLSVLLRTHPLATYDTCVAHDSWFGIGQLPFRGRLPVRSGVAA